MRTHIRYWIAFVLLAMIAASVSAADLDSVAACDIASRFMSKRLTKKGLTSHNITWQLAHAESSVARANAVDYFVLNASDGSSFVIVAGDDRANKVLAYGDRAIDMDRIPDGMRWLLSQYSEQMEYLFSHPDLKASPSLGETSSGQEVIEPLLTTQWGQYSPYRDQCPMVDGKPCVTGCVATSMAQVINYWKYPSILPSLPAYSTSGIYVEALYEETVEWDFMLDTYQGGNYSLDQANAVAILMRYCGQACKMNYGIDRSSAFETNQLEGLKMLGYNQEATCLSRADYNDEEWNNFILEDLTARRPVIYSGVSATMNHNFIIDGYDGSMYHINWGWNGSYDGFFELDAMNVVGTILKDDHKMLHGICPNTASEPQYNFDFVNQGICYHRTSDNTVSVCSNPISSSRSEIIIPETVRYRSNDYTVTAIEDSAYYRRMIKSIELPNTITTIGNLAFGITNISTITIPNSVTNIGTAVFSDCLSLKNVVLNDVVTYISDNMFEGCRSMTNIYFPDCVTHIGKAAFKGAGLTNLIIPATINQIGDEAFMNCSNITRIYIGSSSLTIGNQSFDGIALIEVVCETEVPPNADVSSFSSDVYQSAMLSVPTIANEVYHNTEPWCRFTTIISLDYDMIIDGYYYRQTGNNTVSIHLYQGNEQDLIIPSSFVHDNVTYTVTAIDDFAFRKCEQLKSVIVPNTVMVVGNSAFSSCNKLETVTLCDVLKVINDNTFYDCSALHTINIPDSVTQIGRAAFMNCKNLTSVELPNTLTTISDEAFSTTGLTSITIPEKVNYIGYRAFWGIRSILKVVIECISSFTLGNEAFDKDYYITEVSCKSPDPPIGNYNCFYYKVYTKAVLDVPYKSRHLYRTRDPWFRFSNTIYSDSLLAVIDGIYYSRTSDHTVSISFFDGTRDTVIIPESIVHDFVTYTITAIDENAFSYCSNLKSIVIPNVITSIGSAAFKNCTGLKTVTLNQSITSINNNTFEGCRSLTAIELPNSVTHIGDAAFKGTGLTDLVIPAIVSYIGNDAFMNCSVLENLSIQPTEMSIGTRVFANDPLRNLTCLAEVPLVISSDCFSNSVYQHAILAVPDSSMSLYRESDPWNMFDKIIPIGGNVIYNGIYYHQSGDSTMSLFKYMEGDGCVVIPEHIVVGDRSYRVTAIIDDAFSEMTLKSLTIPGTIEYIGDHAFYDCVIDTLRIQDLDAWCMIDFAYETGGLPPAYYAKHLYYGAEKIRDIILSDKVKRINPLGFAFFYGLESVTLSDSIESIDKFAFYCCFNLQEVHFGKGLRFIGYNAFYWPYDPFVQNLLDFYITDLAAWCKVEIGSRAIVNRWRLFLEDGQLIKDCVIPKGITSIGRQFTHCTSILSVSLPNTLTDIGKEAFCDCLSLEWVSLPEGLQTIGSFAFSDCPSLKKIISKAIIPPVTPGYPADALPFDITVCEDVVLYVPYESLQDYKESPCWGRFAHIKAILPGDVNGDEEVTIADANIIIDAMLAGDYDSLLDVNGDGEVSIADANAIIDIILSH